MHVAIKKLIKLIFNRIKQAIELQTNSELSHAKSLLAVFAIIEIDPLDLPFHRLDPALPWDPCHRLKAAGELAAHAKEKYQERAMDED